MSSTRQDATLDEIVGLGKYGIRPGVWIKLRPWFNFYKVIEVFDDGAVTIEVKGRPIKYRKVWAENGVWVVR